jgi:hypothetical protein
LAGRWETSGEKCNATAIRFELLIVPTATVKNTTSVSLNCFRLAHLGLKYGARFFAILASRVHASRHEINFWLC